MQCNNNVQTNNLRTKGMNSGIGNNLKLPNFVAKKAHQTQQFTLKTPLKTPLLIPNLISKKTGIKYYNPVSPLVRNADKQINISEFLKDEGPDPWIYESNKKGNEIKITAITPLGTVSSVPTCKKNISRNQLMTPSRKMLQHIEKRDTNLYTLENAINDTEEFNSLLRATIYLDCDRDGKNYNYVSERMKSISETTLNLQKRYNNELRELVQISGKVDEKTFEKVLEIYENNQVFYQDKMDNNEIDHSTLCEKLTELEHWFICVIEPKPKDKIGITDWIEREKYKLLTGYSKYCDTELYEYIRPAPENIKNFIMHNHKGNF